MCLPVKAFGLKFTESTINFENYCTKLCPLGPRLADLHGTSTGGIKNLNWLHQGRCILHDFQLKSLIPPVEVPGDKFKFLKRTLIYFNLQWSDIPNIFSSFYNMNQKQRQYKTKKFFFPCQTTLISSHLSLHCALLQVIL